MIQILFTCNTSIRWVFVLSLLGCSYFSMAQTEDEFNTIKDSLYIQEVEGKKGIDKVLHAEPLFIDLIRDLGARKGEKEWNVGLGLSDMTNYEEYSTLIEYEWAPIDRLGLEVELPFSLYYPTTENAQAPGSRLNSIKLAAQHSFFVSEKLKSSMAIGYIHEFRMAEFVNYGKGSVFEGQLFNPFFIVAKRWGNNFHTLIYTGPDWLYNFQDQSWSSEWQMNANFHYMIPGTRNFVGIEMNQTFTHLGVHTILRPQMRVSITDRVLVGVVTGIPISRGEERFSSFLRLIYEPGHRRSNCSPMLN